MTVLIYYTNYLIGAENMSRDDNGQGKEFMRALSVLSQIGITIVVCVAVGIFLGLLLDRLLGTSPWLLIVLTLLGIIAAFKSIFDFARKI